MKRIEIILKPQIDQSDLGIDDDYDYEAVLFEQGYGMDVMEVNAGEKFEIEEHIEEGYLDCEGEMMSVIYKDKYTPPYESDDQIIFERGKYLFHEDGITFEKLDD